MGKLCREEPVQRAVGGWLPAERRSPRRRCQLALSTQADWSDGGHGRRLIARVKPQMRNRLLIEFLFLSGPPPILGLSEGVSGMSTRVRFTPEERDLDLSCLSKADYSLIASLHGNIKHGQKILICQEATVGGAEAEMYIKQLRGRYWAVHFAGSGHRPHEIALESDEHRRQKDYWWRAADDAGYPATTEFSTGGGTILDVAIDGPRRTGVEIQRSYVKTPAVKARTTKSYRVGWLPIWFLDSDRRPPWFHSVPAVNSNRISWGSLPPRRAATALGLTKFAAVRCTAGAFMRCPDGHPRPCGKWHPERQPWSGLTVDDVATLAPVADIVPMCDASGHVHLVSPESLRLFQELTGLRGDYAPGRAGPTGKAPTRSTACTNPHDRRTPRYCRCGQEIYRISDMIRARDDICEGCRIKLGLPAPRLRPVNRSTAELLHPGMLF